MNTRLKIKRAMHESPLRRIAGIMLAEWLTLVGAITVPSVLVVILSEAKNL